MKIYEVMLKEADSASPASPAVSVDDLEQAEERRRERQAAWDRQANAGVQRGSVEASAMQQGSLPEMGKYLRQQFDMKKKTKLKKTGIKEVDDMLEVMGFII